MVHTLKRCAAVVLFALCLQPKTAFSGSPTEQIEQTVGQVLSVVNTPSSGGEETRKKSLQEMVMPRFDWPEMAQQTLGKHWDGLAARQNEFVSAFAEFLSNAYVGKIASYRDEKIVYLHETVDKDRAQVNTKIVPSKGEPTSLNYRLRRVQDDWKIYDVVVEDVSLVMNYRSQFNRILAKGSFDDLFRQLRDKDSMAYKQ